MEKAADGEGVTRVSGEGAYVRETSTRRRRLRGCRSQVWRAGVGECAGRPEWERRAASGM